LTVLFVITVFLSAFLLFLIQPIIGKFILPWFGGSPAVWTTCMLFFQVLLLGGYAYSHFLASRLSARKQAMVHLLLLAATLALLPISPSESWKVGDASLPTWRILGLLAASVGAAYFLLSATGPLLQSWFSLALPKSSPYRLYSLSNAGSLLAIVAYPFLIEPSLGLRTQTRVWSLAYAAFALCCGLCAIRLRKSSYGDALARENAPVVDQPAPAWSKYLAWVSLTVLSSVMLLATTNQICQDMAVIPMLWLLPLGLYLLSFIICFHSDRWYSRLWYGLALGVAVAQTCYVLHRGVQVGIQWQIASYSLTLFVCCMVCHGELVHIKPAARYLTSFYLMIAVGGALGGVFVNFVSPLVFKDYWELHVGLAGTAFIFLLLLFRDPTGRLFHGRPFPVWTVLYLAFAGLVGALAVQIRSSLDNDIEVSRGFFGVLRVLEESPGNPDASRMVLMHGRIEHGYQLLDPEKRSWPTSYFGPRSGIGIALRLHPRYLSQTDSGPMRVGIVGLGTGTLAAYGRKGDCYRFYEINPDVLRISDQYFTYRRDSAANVDVILGDARVSMENELARHQPQQFDVLAVDAFSSDAIPVHLLTRECYQTYWDHLKKDGILAFHISNRYFDLSPVVRGLAELHPESGVKAYMVEDDGNAILETDKTRWILVTGNQEFLSEEKTQWAIRDWTAQDPAPILFTDDYSNLFRLMIR